MADTIKLGNSNITLKVGDSAVTAAYLGSTLVYTGGTTPHDYSQDYLTFRAIEDGTFSFSGSSAAISANTLEYSTDSGSTWSTLQNSGTTPTVTSGNTILWKASGLTIGTGGIGRFSSTSNFEVEGNIMSLLYGDNFVNQTDLTGYDNAFANLFRSGTTITSAENLVLPATTLTQKCYYNMFLGCTSLTTAPELPATTLAERCYGTMFNGCTSLTTAPSLPATTLASQCYSGMFLGCTSLTTAPELPATTLAERCYYQMFQNCTSLNSITCLATDISANYCIRYWVMNVASSGTFTKDANMTSWTTGADGIPSGWTVQDYPSS